MMLRRFLSLYLAVAVVVFPVGAVAAAIERRWLVAGYGAFGTVLLWSLMLLDTTDLVQGVGPVYWCWHALGLPRHRVGVCRMRETDEPYRYGWGVFVTLRKHWLEVGVCRRRKGGDDTAVLAAQMSRLGELPATPAEIRAWDAPGGSESHDELSEA